MDYQLKGKTAFVFSEAHSTRWATAGFLAAERARVIIADIDEAALKPGP